MRLWNPQVSGAGPFQLADASYNGSCGPGRGSCWFSIRCFIRSCLCARSALAFDCCSAVEILNTS